MPDADKRWQQDVIFLAGTNPVRRWHLAKSRNDATELASAKKEARDHLARYWNGPVDKLRATPERFTSRP